MDEKPKVYTYSVEVVKESRAVIQVDASSDMEAEEQARAKVKAKNVDWAIKNQVSVNFTGRKEKNE